MPNIEIKAKCSDLNKARMIAQNLKTDYLGELHQIDTYFLTRVGKLKLREINDSEAQLIPYLKDYSLGPMKSEYTILPVHEPGQLKVLLEKLLGTVVVVDKQREVFLINNVRVHLDNVKNLGSFIEFEAVYEDKDPEQKEREVKKVHDLMQTFMIDQSDLLENSYVDYLLAPENIESRLKTLYLFENVNHVLAEMKRLDRPDELLPENKFFWFLFNKKDKILQRLEFLSMQSSDEQERIFKEGTLRFNKNRALLNIKNQNEELKAAHFLDLEFKNAVKEYFN